MFSEFKLIEYAALGDIDLVRKALLSGTSPNITDDGKRTALHWASQEGFLNIVDALVDSGGNVNQQDEGGFTPLAVAVGEGHLEIVGKLLLSGANPNIRISSCENGTVLHIAASWARTEIAKLVIECSDANVNIRDDSGMTPLAFARDANAFELVEYLVNHGAN